MKRAGIFAVTVILAGCSMPIIAPDTQQAVSARFATSVPKGSIDLNMGWWARFNDPQLTALLELARGQSPDLRTAAANVISARATARQSGADLFPSLSGTATNSISGSDTVSRTTSNSIGLDASWEVDLFSKAASQTKADKARAHAKEVAYAGAYVTLSSEVADYFVQYRACREVEYIYRQALASQRNTLNATSDLVKAGISAPGDQSLARANVASSRININSQSADCQVIAQTLAVIVGVEQSKVTALLSKGNSLPAPKGFRVTSVPADLMRQRPDIIAAELEYAASLKDIRVAQADLYPSLTLSGTLELADPKSWSFGPVLSLPIFQGGARRAKVTKKYALAMIAGESYRSAVLEAVAEVEGALTRLNAARASAGQASSAVADYRNYLTSVDKNWRAGGETLLNREEARRQVQNAQITEVNQREQRLRQWIALYKAMGGGWQGSDVKPHTTVTN